MMKIGLATAAFLLFAAAGRVAEAAAPAPALSMGSNGLVYTTDAMGNRIPDYSYAGYKGGGVALPTMANKIVLSPLAGGADNTSAIQAAINTVSALTPDANGFRGAVFLSPGTYTCSGTLSISTSGVVLRGAGPTSIILATGTARTFMTIKGSSSTSTTGSSTNITDTYVPCNATTFNVASTSGFAVGNNVIINRPTTQTWIDAIHMGQTEYLGTEGWTPNSGLKFERKITAILGTQITIDIPLPNPLEAQYTSATGTSCTMQKYTDSRNQSMGLENLTLTAFFSDVPPQTSPGNPLNSSAVSMDNTENSWMKNVKLNGYGNGLTLGGGTKWCNIMDCDYQHSGTDSTTAAQPAAYTVSGRQCLVARCTSSNSTEYHMMVTQAYNAGPDVFLDCKAVTSGWLDSSPHQKWAAGILFDRIIFLRTSGTNKCELDLNNRNDFGTGQGWSMGFSTEYNCQTVGISCQEPSYIPYHYNWCIGGIGNKLTTSNVEDPPGEYQNFGTLVSPSSLYLQQLQERLGTSAVANTGYARFAGNYKLINKSSGEAAIVQSSSTANNAAVVQLGFPGTANAKWQFVDVGGGRYEIKNLNSGKALAVAGNSTSAGALIVQTAYTGNGFDQWTLSDLPGGMTQIINKGSGKTLAVPLGAPPDNLQLMQATYASQSSQQFTIVSAP